MPQSKAPEDGALLEKPSSTRPPPPGVPELEAPKQPPTRKREPLQGATPPDKRQRLALPTPAPLPKLTPAQMVELENLAAVRYNNVRDALARNDTNTDALRRELHYCAQDMLTVQNASKLYQVLGTTMQLALRCERNEDRPTASSIYNEVLSYVPQNAPREAQRIRGLALQRLGNMQGGSAGCALLAESLNLLAEPEDRGNGYLYLGKHQSAQPTQAVQAFEEACKAFNAANDLPNMAKAVVHWAGAAHGIEPDRRIAERLERVVQLPTGATEPAYEATAYLELGRAYERLDMRDEAWVAYSRALKRGRTGHQVVVEPCLAALDRLAAQSFWRA